MDYGSEAGNTIGGFSRGGVSGSRGGSSGGGYHRDNDSVESFDMRKSFKAKKSLGQRQAESLHIKTKFPAKIPVIVERYEKESTLPHLDKTKFLVPQELTMGQFATIIRNRMRIDHSQAFYLVVNNKSIASMSATVAEIYEEERDEDGFLYMSYASQEMFGCCCRCRCCCCNLGTSLTVKFTDQLQQLSQTSCNLESTASQTINSSCLSKRISAECLQQCCNSALPVK